MSRIVLTIPNTPESIEKENKQLKVKLLLLKKVVSVDSFRILESFRAIMIYC